MRKTFSKKIIAIVLVAVIVCIAYYFHQPPYLESSSDVTGKWVDLPIKGESLRSIKSIVFGNGYSSVLEIEGSFLLLMVKIGLLI